MLFLVILGFLHVIHAKEIIPGFLLKTESGRFYHIDSVTDKEQAYYESEKGCSLKCAEACSTYSQGDAVIQCTHHCGCESLINEISEIELYQDLSIDIKYPRGDDKNWKIKIESENEFDETKKWKFTGNSTKSETGEEAHIVGDVKGGNPNGHDYELHKYKTYDKNTNASNTYVE